MVAKKPRSTDTPRSGFGEDEAEASGVRFGVKKCPAGGAGGSPSLPLGPAGTRFGVENDAAEGEGGLMPLGLLAAAVCRRGVPGVAPNAGLPVVRLPSASGLGQLGLRQGVAGGEKGEPCDPGEPHHCDDAAGLQGGVAPLHWALPCTMSCSTSPGQWRARRYRSTKPYVGTCNGFSCRHGTWDGSGTLQASRMPRSSSAQPGLSSTRRSTKGAWNSSSTPATSCPWTPSKCCRTLQMCTGKLLLLQGCKAVRSSLQTKRRTCGESNSVPEPKDVKAQHARRMAT
mmetsp:Transcript_9502/g.21108  ORF Transcript_9502/g.21108 Transcript_9502/m.21108 type:complete len:285 (+) Transcript_9502:1125-1979(+)